MIKIFYRTRHYVTIFITCNSDHSVYGLETMPTARGLFRTFHRKKRNFYRFAASTDAGQYIYMTCS